MTVAVVTGASAGVGRAVAQMLAARGYDVGLIARGAAGLDAAYSDVEALGRRAVAVTADVADWTQVDRAATRIEEELGPIDVWVNNAMTTVFGPFSEVSPDDFKRATEVTYLGQVHGTMAALGRMRPRNRGRIVNVGSALAFVGIPLQSAYCGAKFAVRGFTQSVQAELFHDGSEVRIAQVHLPAVNTPQFEWCKSFLPKRPQPVPPIYQPEDAAEAILAALDGRRSSILGSWNRVIITAAKVMPGVVVRYAGRTGYSSQQTKEPVPADRPSNLYQPVDDEADFGAHGRFDRRARGALHPSFLRSLPRTLSNLLWAVVVTARDGVVRRTRSSPPRSRGVDLRAGVSAPSETPQVPRR